MSTKKNAHYIDNQKLLVELSEYSRQFKQAQKAGLERPQASNYIGECIQQIANRLSSVDNFANYPFREEMIGDAVENCIMYMHNFDPEKTSYAFSYLTKIIYWAFLRRIYKERKQLYTKFIMTREAQLHNLGHSAQIDDDVHDGGLNIDNDTQQYMDKFIADFENKLGEIKKKRGTELKVRKLKKK